VAEGGGEAAGPTRRELDPAARRRAIGCLFAGAMVGAPFLALLYDLAAGLAVMAVALGATAYLAADAARGARPEVRRRLVVFAVVNGALAAICLWGLLARIV
jgi:hypothetical protein